MKYSLADIEHGPTFTEKAINRAIQLSPRNNPEFSSHNLKSFHLFWLEMKTNQSMPVQALYKNELNHLVPYLESNMTVNLLLSFVRAANKMYKSSK